MSTTYKRLSSSSSSSSNSLEIKTKSIETILVPLLTQIATLVHFKEKSRSSSEKHRTTIRRVGEEVFSAVERFVSVGTSIGHENPDIRTDLADACREARLAGEAIKENTSDHGTDRQTLVQAARTLLTAVTRVLILADTVVLKQIIVVKKNVNSILNQLEKAPSFSDFMKLFAVYGTTMVDFAHLTGDRQNDLKDERRRSQLSASRTILEKSTTLILTSSKVYLRHHHCLSARQCRDLVFSQVRRALDMAQWIIMDSGSTQLNQPANLTALLTKDEMNFVKSLRKLEYAIEMLHASSTSSTAEELQQLCARTLEQSQDFIAASCVSTDERDRILHYHRQMQNRLNDLVPCISNPTEASSTALPSIIESLQQIARDFRRQLEQVATLRASEFFRNHQDLALLSELKLCAMTNGSDLLQIATDRFREQSELVIELTQLLRHVSSCDPLQVSSEYHDLLFQNLSQMILLSVQSLSMHPHSRVAQANLDVLCRVWEDQMNDFAVLVKEIQDQIEGRGEKNVYLSLPRPGKPSTTVKPSKLDKDEQAKVAKLGLELKLITAEMDAEAEKWKDPSNEIIKRAKNMSSMAYSLHLFTRGEGTLRTTQDFFTQASYFLEEGMRLITLVHRPNSADAEPYFDRIPLICHQLKLKLNTSVSAKLAVYTKVEAVLSEVRDLMQAVTRLCITLFSDSSHQRVLSRPPAVPSKRTSSRRSVRTASLQRPRTYLPTVDHI